MILNFNSYYPISSLNISYIGIVLTFSENYSIKLIYNTYNLVRFWFTQQITSSFPTVKYIHYISSYTSLGLMILYMSLQGECLHDIGCTLSQQTGWKILTCPNNLNRMKDTEHNILNFHL